MTCVVPEAPPQDVNATAVGDEEIKVSWNPPPVDKHNGPLTGYKVFYMQHEERRPDSEASVHKVGPAVQMATLTGLKTWTAYNIWVLAMAHVGDGPKSPSIVVRTDENGMYVD